jgi:hypothetical protein
VKGGGSVVGTGLAPLTPTNPRGWAANRKEEQRRVAKKRKKEDNPFQKSNEKGASSYAQ